MTDSFRWYNEKSIKKARTGIRLVLCIVAGLIFYMQYAHIVQLLHYLFNHL